MAVLVLLCALCSCGGEDGADEAARDGGRAPPDAEMDGSGGDASAADGGRPAACTPEAGFVPGQEDDWPACVADDGDYAPIGDGVDDVRRVVLSYETIASFLFDPVVIAPPDDFAFARSVYLEDGGLRDRALMLADPHVDAPPEVACTVEADVAAHPDHCIGATDLVPAVDDAFAMGEMDRNRHVQAGRIDAGLTWFLLLASDAGAHRCRRQATACDAAYGWYTGGETARGGIAVARAVSRAEPDVHDAVWDGLLALRCWRDVDPAEPVSRTELADRAIAQVDRALGDAFAALMLDRLDRFERGELAADYFWGYATTLGELADGLIGRRDVDAAESVAEVLAAEDPGEADLDRLRLALVTAFPCAVP